MQAPELKTCNPGSMKFVTDKEEVQQVAENKEIIFSYDVLFRVRAVLRSGPGVNGSPPDTFKLLVCPISPSAASNSDLVALLFQPRML